MNPTEHALHPTQCWPVQTAFVVGSVISIDCTVCGHSGYLHSLHRGCVGCESNTIAIETADKIIELGHRIADTMASMQQASGPQAPPGV